MSRQLLAAETAIADPATTGRELRGAARLQQLAYRVLGTRPGWDDAVYAALPPRLHPVVRDNVAARREFRSMHTTLSDTLPAWRIVEPEPAEDLMRFYRDAEAAYGVGWEYLAAINLVETAMGRIRGTSVAGAQGPMQFIPTTWARWGRGDVDDPADSIMAAARYLASNGFARGPRGVANALFEYNNHPAYVRGVTAYAKVMERRPRAFLAYHQWDVYYLTTEGDVVLPVGYERTQARAGAPLPGRTPAAVVSRLVTETSPPAWGGDPSIAWRILLTAVPTTPLDGRAPDRAAGGAAPRAGLARSPARGRRRPGRSAARPGRGARRPSRRGPGRRPGRRLRLPRVRRRPGPARRPRRAARLVRRLVRAGHRATARARGRWPAGSRRWPSLPRRRVALSRGRRRGR